MVDIVESQAERRQELGHILAHQRLHNMWNARREHHLHAGIHHIPAHNLQRVGPKRALSAKQPGMEPNAAHPLSPSSLPPASSPSTSTAAAPSANSEEAIKLRLE